MCEIQQNLPCEWGGAGNPRIGITVELAPWAGSGWFWGRGGRVGWKQRLYYPVLGVSEPYGPTYNSGSGPIGPLFAFTFLGHDGAQAPEICIFMYLLVYTYFIYP